MRHAGAVVNHADSAAPDGVFVLSFRFHPPGPDLHSACRARNPLGRTVRHIASNLA